MNLQTLLLEKHVLICCGSGGVGKTTTSAALAIRAAMEGRRVVVITIDPAKRLATSLGLKSLESKPTDITAIVSAALVESGREPLKGSLHAVMPNTTKTFEEFVRSLAGKNQALGARILKTSIFKIFAREFSGANEYMAMEKLYALNAEEKFDLVVLDTPPSSNTKTFLEAPRMLADFFDDRVMKWFINPGSRLLASGVKMLMEILERLTGRGFISDLIDFTAALFELRGEFLDNLRRVENLLRESQTSFLMVTSPERVSKGDTIDFVQLLQEKKLPFWGFIMNRVLCRRLGLQNGPLPSREGMPPSDLPLLDAFEIIRFQLEHEREVAEFLKSIGHAASNVAMVEEQPKDVHSIQSLLGIATTLESP